MIKLHYCRANNFGDAMNPILIERLAGQKCVYAGKHNANIVGIGSILNGLARPRASRIVSDIFASSMVVWTSGFLKEVPWKEKFRKNIKYAAVRGKITKARIEKIVGHSVDAEIGDGGLLFGRLLDKRSVKKYALGLTPHCKDIDNPIWRKIVDTYPNSYLIDFRDDPLNVLQKIAECDFVLSSAMHGLIAADSLGIPNQWIQLSELSGGDYKYRDYYSVFDITPKCLKAEDINNGDMSAKMVSNMTDCYEVDAKKVELVQQKLLSALLKNIG